MFRQLSHLYAKHADNICIGTAVCGGIGGMYLTYKNEKSWKKELDSGSFFHMAFFGIMGTISGAIVGAILPVVFPFAVISGGIVLLDKNINNSNSNKYL